MDSAHVGGVALRSLAAEPAEKLLQQLDVLVAEDGRYKLGPLVVVPCDDADVPLEFPLAAFRVPCAPCGVSVAPCGVFVASRSEEVCGNLGCLVAADVVHFDFYANRLVLHVLNLPCGVLFHFRLPLSLIPCAAWRAVCFPACTYIYHSNENNYQVLFCVYMADFCIFLKGILPPRTASESGS